MPITLLVADDHPAVREGLHAILKGSDIQIVGEVSTGNAAIELAMRLKPDVALVDVRMPETDGLEASERILDRSSSTKIVIFTAHESPSYVARAAALGASAFLLKGAAKEEIVAAIKNAHAGLPPDPESSLGKMRVAIPSRRSSFDEEVPLTNREVQVLRLVTQGLSNREIGRSLEIGTETVKEHVQNILRKLEADDRTDAAIWAVRKGLA